MVKIAWTLLVVASALLMGYITYDVARELLNEAPWPVAAGIALVFGGSVILLGIAITDRIRKIKQEDFNDLDNSKED